jgi:hypothetical protein
MLVDLSVLFKGTNTIIIAVVLTVVALLGKWLAAFVAQLFFKFSATQRQIIFGLSSAHAAATLAIILVGFKVGIIDEYILNGTIILILVTCLIASFVTESAAKQLILEEDSDTSVSMVKEEALKQENILVPVSNYDNLELILDLASLFKNKKSTKPITILSVVPDNDTAEFNLNKAKKKLNDTVKYASASETNLDIAVTIDINIVGGIVRTAKEKSSNLILSGWPQKASLIDKFLGDNHTASIIDGLNKDLFACHIQRPLVTLERIVVISPPLAEYEFGFKVWLSKVHLFAKELSLPVLFICNDNTESVLKKLIKEGKFGFDNNYSTPENWDNLFPIAIRIKQTDLIFMVSARKGSVSYHNILDGIEVKLDKYYQENNKILVYPQTEKVEHVYTEYNDMRAETLTKGLQTIKNVQRGVFRIFKKK